MAAHIVMGARLSSLARGAAVTEASTITSVCAGVMRSKSVKTSRCNASCCEVSRVVFALSPPPMIKGQKSVFHLNTNTFDEQIISINSQIEYQLYISFRNTPDCSTYSQFTGIIPLK